MKGGRGGFGGLLGQGAYHLVEGRGEGVITVDRCVKEQLAGRLEVVLLLHRLEEPVCRAEVRNYRTCVSAGRRPLQPGTGNTYCRPTWRCRHRQSPRSCGVCARSSSASPAAPAAGRRTARRCRIDPSAASCAVWVPPASSSSRASRLGCAPR